MNGLIIKSEWLDRIILYGNESKIEKKFSLEN